MTLQWFKKPLLNQFELKETKKSAQIYATLKVKGTYPSSVKGLGTYDGKEIEMKLIKEGLYFTIIVNIIDDSVEWGHYRGRSTLHREPGILQLSDGRIYYLKKVEWDKFRLYTKDDRTIAITTYQSATFFKIYFEIIDCSGAESDYPLLALATLMPIVLWNHQTG